MYTPIKYYQSTINQLDKLAWIIPLLALRAIMAWEYGEAGYQKLIGENWFSALTFPFPFNLLSPELNWQFATWFELIGAAALLIGFATRFFALSLIILTLVAIASVHWPVDGFIWSELLTGYRIIDEGDDGLGNFKLPVIFIVMLMPLMFFGAGKWSLDAWLKQRLHQKHSQQASKSIS